MEPGQHLFTKHHLHVNGAFFFEPLPLLVPMLLVPYLFGRAVLDYIVDPHTLTLYEVASELRALTVNDVDAVAISVYVLSDRRAITAQLHHDYRNGNPQHGQCKHE